MSTYSNKNLSTSRKNYIRKADLGEIKSQYEKSVVSSKDETPIQKVNNAYGKEVFNQLVKDLNFFLKEYLNQIEKENIKFNVKKKLPPLYDFSYLDSRLEKGVVITRIEVAEFILQKMLCPVNLTQMLYDEPVMVLTYLNDYYTENFTEKTMSSFCSLAPSIFGAITSFFSLASDPNSFLGSLIGEDPSATTESSMLSTLREQNATVIDEVFTSEKSVVENYNFSDNTTAPATFVNDSIYTRSLELKEQATGFFTDENKENITTTSDDMIGYTASVFEQPQIEEIQFIVYRFCSLIGNIEELITGVKNPMMSYTDNYNLAYPIISSSSNYNTSRAVSSGAIRFTPETRKDENIAIQGATYAEGESNPQPILATDIAGVTSWNNGQGDSKIRFGPGLQTGGMGEEGWTRVNPTARIYLMRLQARFGRQLQVNSGYRSPAYNASVGGAKASQHMAGNALDVSWDGMTQENREEYIKIGYEVGFLGVGRYGSFIHLDLGPRRSWNG